MITTRVLDPSLPMLELKAKSAKSGTWVTLAVSQDREHLEKYKKDFNETRRGSSLWAAQDGQIEFTITAKEQVKK